MDIGNLMTQAGLPGAVAAVALVCLLAAAVSDILKFEIPDELSIAILVGALAYGLVAPQFGWLSHLAAPLGFFAFGLLAFSRGWLGGGDVKLMTAVSAWTGLGGLLPMMVGTALAGGVLALVLIIVRRLAAARVTEGTHRLFRREAPLPYAVAIAAGTLWWAVLAWPIR
jgi:prepilin peptidase CpaA